MSFAEDQNRRHIFEIIRAMAQGRPAKHPTVATLRPARDHIVALMREQVEAIRAHEPGTRAGADPEQLHRMRTAVRRLRAILGATREMFDPTWLGRLRGELDWLGTVLGARRDLDVFRQRLREDLGSLKSARRVAGRVLLNRLDAERARARDAILAALDSPRYVKLLDLLDKAVEHPRVVTANLSLPAIAAGQFRKLRKAVKALPERPSDHDLHAVRIKVKRARYAAELAQTTVGRPAERFVARARKLQDILGEHQDAVVAEERLRALVARDAGRSERVLAGELLNRQRARRQAAQMDFFDQWPKLKRRGDKAWRSE
jgi:CHAD domain-containing protein